MSEGGTHARGIHSSRRRTRDEKRRDERRGEEEKRVNRARLARIGEAAGRDVRDSGVRALLIHTQQSQTETHARTHTHAHTAGIFSVPSAAERHRIRPTPEEEAGGPGLSRFGFYPPFVHFI
ncbi:hypothetical protein F2P79_015373 [Pimephales promelas]|nr:hypothetical protein F2P79_015373 [Pimephales promelas]